MPDELGHPQIYCTNVCELSWGMANSQTKPIASDPPYFLSIETRHVRWGGTPPMIKHVLFFNKINVQPYTKLLNILHEHIFLPDLRSTFNFYKKKPPPPILCFQAIIVIETVGTPWHSNISKGELSSRKPLAGISCRQMFPRKFWFWLNAIWGCRVRQQHYNLQILRLNSKILMDTV